MPEFIKTAEVIGNVAQKVHGLAKFVTERVVGIGAWAEMSEKVHEPSPANIQVREAQLPLEIDE